MKTYEVEIRMTNIITIRANDKDEAIDKVYEINAEELIDRSYLDIESIREE